MCRGAQLPQSRSVRSAEHDARGAARGIHAVDQGSVDVGESGQPRAHTVGQRGHIRLDVLPRLPAIQHGVDHGQCVRDADERR